MQRDYSFEAFNYWLFKDRIPITKLVIISNIATFLAVALFKINAIDYYMSFNTATFGRMPWTAVSYPLYGQCCSPINLLFSGYFLWWAGGSLERSWSSRVFGIFFFSMSAITALGLLIGSFATGIPVSIAGLWLPIAGVVVAFAMLNPEQVILFFFIIPMKLKYLALIDVALVFISFGKGSLLLGVLALVGCVFSFRYVQLRGRISFQTTPSARRGDVIHLYENKGIGKRLNPMKWIRNYREQKRLKDFLDKSEK